MDLRETDLDDAGLVLAVQHGDGRAFAALFDRHYAGVRAVCTHRMGSTLEADEVTQAAFVRAFERIDQCSGERNFGAWVQVIAVRLCADAWRAQVRTVPVDQTLAAELTTGPDECEEAILRSERAAAVRRALASLPPRQRQVIVARDIEGRRPTEIAAALALSVGAVDSLLLRARRRMAMAYRSASVEQGAASASVSTASVAAGSAAAGPLPRIVESLTALLHAGAANLATAMGVGPAAPAAAQRLVGGVVAATLLVAPLALVDDGARPAATAPVAVPALGVPGTGAGSDLAEVAALPVSPPAAPGVEVPPAPPPAAGASDAATATASEAASATDPATATATHPATATAITLALTAPAPTRLALAPASAAAVEAQAVLDIRPPEVSLIAPDDW